jgi:hypothetical protein
MLAMPCFSSAFASDDPRQIIESFEQEHPGVRIGVLAYDLDVNRLIIA